jgi:hypothetical protein
VIDPLWDNMTVLGKVPTQGVDALCPLPHQKVTDPEHRAGRLLRFSLHRHTAPARPLHRLADRLGIRHIALLPLDAGLPIGRRDQPHRMAQLADLPRPMVGSATGLQRHNTRCLSREELEDLGPCQALAEYHPPARIGALGLDYLLRNVEPDRASLSHGRLLWWLLDTSTSAHRCRRGASTPSTPVKVGNAEADASGRQVFAAVAGSGTDVVALIGGTLDSVGRTKATVLTGFTNGCVGLQLTVAAVGVTALPILDWFHIAMRLQHLEQTTTALSTDTPARQEAKAVIAAEADRLRWRLWNGKAKDAQASIERIRAVIHHFRGEPGSRRSIAPSRKLWPAVLALDAYLVSQADCTVNYAERHRAGLRVGTAITEGMANFLVNRRMTKSQQMRWTQRGTDLLLQVRCAVYNGTFGSAFGQRFAPANDPHPILVAAA